MAGQPLKHQDCEKLVVLVKRIVDANGTWKEKAETIRMTFSEREEGENNLDEFIQWFEKDDEDTSTPADTDDEEK